MSSSTDEIELPRPLPGFETINHYWDKQRQMPAAKILPGEYYVTTHDELITTVLGSCVSACIRDRVFGIGGMNHFMLPQLGGVNNDDEIIGAATRYGNYAMEHMINDLLKHGAKRQNLELKLTGGGCIIKGMTNIGKRNIEFVMQYIETEGLLTVVKDLGGDLPRKVVYLPRTGQLLVKKLRNMHNRTILTREENYRENLIKQPVTGEIDLF
ncbi:MAG: chemoreceptor glutamine deamidase CheD [Gammaproteobacteria bacterium]|nr:chemoreceptor glutamine deamidase CheD [Gammaproteobacteria bacterium]